jgi:hypothetical protein
VINGGTVVCPDNRKQLELGIFTLKTPVKDSEKVEKTVMFNPLVLLEDIQSEQTKGNYLRLFSI